ncbi:MAG: potassium channel family protein [Halioglobus sp.]
MFAVYVVNMFVIALVVMIHYEFLHRVTLLMPMLKVRHRFRIVLGVFLALTAHAAEVWIFGISYYFMNQAESWGHLQGNFNGSLLDCVYFSFTSYTTLGTGDIEPHGHLRFLAGLESLTGLVLITWTASFLYLEMTRYWDEK